MRKLIACLLAVLMLALPSLTMAEEAQSLTLALDTDAARLSPVVTALAGKENPELCESLAELISSCVLEGRWQEDATITSFSLNGETLLETAMLYAGDKVTYITSFAPGYALQTAIGPQLDWEQLLQCDWAEEKARLTERVETLAASLEQTEETGSFLGDAYEGGVRRVTCRLDDRTIYLLAECFLTTLEQSEGFAASLSLSMEELHAFLAQLRESLLPGALENAYRYQFSLVYDEDDELVGVSLTALEGNKQISTLSVGPMEDGLEAVWGYGLNGMNYYMRLILLTEESEDGTQAMGLRLSVLEDPMHMGYAMISKMDSSMVEEHVLSMAFSPSAEETAFSGEYQHSSPEDSATLVWNGTCHADPFSLNAVADVYETGTDDSLLTLHLTTGTCDAITADTEGLTVLDLDTMDADAEAELDDAVDRAITDMAFTLFRVLPAELLIMMLQ